jgi:GNAT superfamily N-acetyltransferase
MVLFYYDLPKRVEIKGKTFSVVQVERISNIGDLNQQYLERIVEFWNPSVAQRQIRERFQKGGTLWLALSAKELAGFGWTIVGRTITPHYFSLGSNDVHLFDFLVFPEHRGRGVNPALVTHILNQMYTEGRSRAYIESAEWNRPQLISLSKTGFQVIGTARKVTLFERTFVQWS